MPLSATGNPCLGRRGQLCWETTARSHRSIRISTAQNSSRWNSQDATGRHWTYLPYGPFPNEPEYMSWLNSVHRSDDPQFYAIIDLATDQPMGVASYLRIDSPNGVIEVGHIKFSPAMQRTPLGTEAMYLMMRNAFQLGYRRYEWKCDAPEQAILSSSIATGISVRRHLPSGPHQQGAQPRHGLVCHHRQGLASVATRI